ncbi:uncharacterized protein ATC70_012456 [Mucor velutinosus]|uniref:Uncharacterized protein n=1 Tax=Mucor velutinosus TaxID=708070 RepID=A0AAN7D679_9FUNG|nr:hypothetical protein ATC70_012456 [Mucor velutinosus]
MKRRNTIDSLHVNWPIVQYYYTHNNGSCDDILIQHKSFDTPRQIHHNQPNHYNNRRRTFPLEKPVPGGKLHHHPQNRRHSHKIQIVTPTPIVRRGSSYQNQQQQQQQKQKKKRETLANIIYNLSRSNSSTLTSGNISSTMNHDDTPRVDSDLDIKWETIRQYNPQLDNEKILEQVSQDEDESYSYDLTSQEQSNHVAAVAMNDGSNNSSSDDSNGLFLPAGQEESGATGSSDAMSIQMDAATNSHEMPATTAIALKTELPTAITLVPMSNIVDHTDMFLFLFGFIMFPLWWIGTWRFFMQSDKTFLHKQQRAFQIVNCCMALASLLLTGLIIGLVTVWA